VPVTCPSRAEQTTGLAGGCDFKEAQERAEKEAREKERQERIKARKNKRGMER